MESLKITMLGEFSIASGKTIIREKHQRSPKMWQLLEYLIVNRGSSVSHAELIKLLWQGGDDGSIGALKTLVHRLRKLLQPFEKGLEEELVVSDYGVYAWNEKAEIDLDTDRLEQLCEKMQNCWSIDQKKIIANEIFELYKGDFLPTRIGDEWTQELRKTYHENVVEAVMSLVTSLEDIGRFEDVMGVCQRALLIAPKSTDINIAMVLAMLKTGKTVSANVQFKKVISNFFSRKNAQPSQSDILLYDEIFNAIADDKTHENVFDQLLKDIREDGIKPAGSYYCEFGFFKKLIELEVRYSRRYGHRASLFLLSLVPIGESSADKWLSEGMEKLCEALSSVLRRSDVYSQASNTQCVVLLYNVKISSDAIIAGRILEKYNSLMPSGTVGLKSDYIELSDFLNSANVNNAQTEESISGKF